MYINVYMHFHTYMYICKYVYIFVYGHVHGAVAGMLGFGQNVRFQALTAAVSEMPTCWTLLRELPYSGLGRFMYPSSTYSE